MILQHLLSAALWLVACWQVWQLLCLVSSWLAEQHRAYHSWPTKEDELRRKLSATRGFLRASLMASSAAGGEGDQPPTDCPTVTAAELCCLAQQCFGPAWRHEM